MKINYKKIAATGLIYCFLPILSFSEPVRSAAEPDYPPLSIVNPDGQASGLSVELLRAALAEMGREVVFEIGSLVQIKKALAEGALDVLPLVGRTPEREALYDFTIPYLTLHGALFIRNDNTTIQGLSDLPGQRIAVMKGDNAEEYVRRARLSDQIITTSSFDEAFRMLSDGRADAVIAQKLMGVSLLKELGLKNVSVVGKPIEEFKQNFCFAVKKGNAELLSVLNEGLAVIKTKGIQRQLLHKWMGDSEQDALRARIIIYGGDWAYPPYEFLDDKGRPSGFNIDLARAIAVEMGVEIAFQLEAWSSMRQKMDVGEIDMASMAYNPERAKQFEYSVPHAVLYSTVFSRIDSPPYKTLEDLKNHPIAVQKGDISHELALAQGLEKTLTVTESTEAALSLLANEKVDFVLGNYIPGLYWIHKNGWKNLRAENSTDFVQEYCFVVQKDNTTLLNLFSEGLQRLKESGEYRQIYNKWMKVLDPAISRHVVLKWVLVSLAVALLLAAISGAIIFGLNRQIIKRTAQLRKSNLTLKESQLAALNMMEDALADKDQLEHLQAGLKESELKYRTLADSGQVLIWTSGVDKRCNYFNQIWLDFTGRSFEQEIGEGWTEGLYPEDFDYCIQTYVTAFDQHKPFSMEYRMRHVSGEYRWIQDEGTPRFDEKGVFLGYIGHCLDITDRKKAEEARSEAQQLLKDVINTIPVRVFWKDKNLVYLGCSEAFARDAGFSGPAEVIGKHDHQLVWKAQAEQYNADDRRVIAGEFILDREESLTTLEGKTLCVLTNKVPLRNSRGDIIGMLGAYVDITGQRLLEAQFQQAQKMEAIGRLAGGVAHDFNNMLQVILGHTEFAINKTGPNSPIATDLLEILKAGKNSAALTQQLLTFARKEVIAPKILDLNDAISEMRKMLKWLIGGEITLVWKPGTVLHPVQFDPSQLNQIVANLCINARDAIGGQGQIVLETSDCIFDADYCAAHPDVEPGAYVCLTVSDNGCGMDQGTLAHIFEPFFTTKGPNKGTGLGLSTVYGIVKQNNGSISVCSKPGQGTSFKIYLPQVTTKTAEISIDREPVLIKGRKETILLVEDEPALLSLSNQLLNTLGYTVLAAATPKEALALFSKHQKQIQLLLTDVIMPEMNGQELADKIHVENPDLKVLYMSGYTADVIVDQGVLIEHIELLTKPFTLNALACKIRNVLDA